MPNFTITLKLVNCAIFTYSLLFTQNIDDFVLRVGKVYQCRLVEI